MTPHAPRTPGAHHRPVRLAAAAGLAAALACATALAPRALGAQQGPAPLAGPWVTLREAHALVLDGDSVSIGGRATVRGGVLHARALDVALDDGTAGLRLFKRLAAGLAVREGDSLVARGVVKRYRGALELEASEVRVIPAPPRAPVAPVVLAGGLVRPEDEGRLVQVRGTASQKGRSEGGWWIMLVAEPAPDGRRDSVTLWAGAAHVAPPEMERVHVGDRMVATGVLSAYRDNPTDPLVWQVMPREREDLVLLGVPGYMRERARWLALVIGGTAVVMLGMGWAVQRRQRRALREVEDRYQQLLALSPEAVLVFGGDAIRFANPAAARLLGMAGPEELVGQPIARFWPEARKADDKSLEAPARTRLVAADGEAIDVEAAASPCRYHDKPATVVLARDVRAQLRHERELRALAQLDELTGAFNRRGFALHAETMRREHAQAGRPLALVLADLDALKGINDTHGHAAGDAAILIVAGALRTALGDDALLARWGGDEFAAIVTLPAAGDDAVRSLGDRLQGSLSRLGVPGTSLTVSASVGIAPLPPGGAQATVETLALADERLYERKRARQVGQER